MVGADATAPGYAAGVIQLRRLGPEAIGYQDAWDLQRRTHADVVAGRLPDTVLLLEHVPVYTAGRRTEPTDRPLDGTPVVDVDRGGRITWHGPGQLVGYPIVRLPMPLDVMGHVRRLEDALIAACGDLGLVTTRVAGRSGVWVAQGVTQHGFALNCDCDLAAFDRIVPCGIPDAGVTSLTAELGRPVTVADALPIVEARTLEALTGQVVGSTA